MILPEDTDLPDLIIGQEFTIEFTSDPVSEIEIEPQFNIQDYPIVITDNVISGRYTADSGVTYKTVSPDFTRSEYNKFSDIPEQDEVYHFITSRVQRYTFVYKVTSGSDVKFYTQQVFTDWTMLSQDFRSLFT